jgi:hypothetical protein
MSWQDGRLTEAVIHSQSNLPCTVICGNQRWTLPAKAGQKSSLPLAEPVSPRRDVAP